MSLSKNIFATAAVVTLANFAGAQYVSSTIANDFNDISDGTDLLITGDDAGVLAPLGFTFEYFGNPITEIGVSSNGYMSDGGALGDFSADCIPSGGAGEADRISPFQGDYSPNIAGVIYSKTEGSAGSMTCTIQWDAVPAFFSGGGDSAFTFQAVLAEADNSIEFHYGTLDGGVIQAAPVDGSEQVIGIEGAGGTVGFEISCASPIAGGEGYRFEIPAIQPAAHAAPASACIGDTVTISGSGEPGHFWGIAVSASNGPTGFLDLGPDFVDNIIGSGILDGTGSTGDITIAVPATLTCGQMGFSQMLTIGGFAPISGVSKSTAVATTFNSCQTLLGSGDLDDTTADLYSFAGTAGDVITITLCRIGTEVDGSSLLDPRVCVYDSAAVIPGAGLGTIQNDDTLGDCFVTGPFGASIIEDWTIPATDTYTIAASNWDGSEGPYELGVTGCTGTVTLVGDEVAGGCFN